MFKTILSYIKLYPLIFVFLVGCTSYCNYSIHDIRPQAYIQSSIYAYPPSQFKMIADLEREYGPFTYHKEYTSHNWIEEHEYISIYMIIYGRSLHNSKKKIEARYSLLWSIDWCARTVEEALTLSDAELTYLVSHHNLVRK